MKPLRNYFRRLNRSSFPLVLGVVLLLSPPAVSLCQAGGSVFAWGANDAQQSTVPAGLGNVVAVAGGESHSLALQSDGTVVAWGFNLSGQATVPANLIGVTAIAGGGTYSMALTANGTVVVWGSQSQPPASVTNVIAIAAGGSHSLALRADGTVVSWGAQTIVPAGLSNVVAIAAGNGNSLALVRDGTVVAWGDDSYGKAEVPSSATNVMAIAAGGDHCLVLRSNSTIVAWGRNDYGQISVPAGLGTLVGISAGALHSLALKADGTVAAWGDDTYGQTSINAGSVGFISVQAGGYHNLAIKNDGTPFILSQPVSQIQPLTSRATFSVFAIGTAPLSYQWQHDGTNLTGAVGSSVTLFNLKLTDSGPYTVKVSNSRGSAISASAILTVVGGAPLVSIPPQSQTAVCGDAVIFQVVAGGTTNLTYQWSFQGQDIPGATRTFYLVPNVSPALAGTYNVSISNDFGLVITGAVLNVSLDPPHITSALADYGNQGQPYSYQIQAMHRPIAFDAQFLPDGLSINTTNGIISGTPTNSGPFFPVITAISPCSSDTQVLLLSIAPGIPVIRGPSLITGTENAPIPTSVINASGTPTLYGAQNLPTGIQVEPTSGGIFGTPTFGGEFDSTIWASNVWGVGSANLHLSIANALINNLLIDNITYDYSAPFLLDFQFSLFTLSNTNDPSTAQGVVVNPNLFSAVLAMEDSIPVGSESVPFISPGSSKLIKVQLVLDFTESISSLQNGDLNGNGMSDAVDNMVAGALDFINQQASDTQVGVWEFHRDDEEPNQVMYLTTDRTLLSQAIGGIWTNYVQDFPAGSRCWDAVTSAINDLGQSNRDEQHFVVVISDGTDGSSTNTLSNVITLANNNNVRVFSVGFGLELVTNNLQMLSQQTQGRYHTATNSGDIASAFAQITKDSKAQYVLRWATLKRPPNPLIFTPSFAVGYLGIMATSPPNTVMIDTNNPIIDTNQTPPVTNYTMITNLIIGEFDTSSNAGPVTVGSLRVVPEAEVSPTTMTLRSAYTPRYVRQLRIHYRANWPCTTTLESTGPGQILEGWGLSETDDGAGGKWLLISSADPADRATSIPFAAFGRLVTFNFQDAITASNAFSLFAVDNSIYTNTGGQSFIVENANSVTKVYPVLPYGTPVPWLISLGYIGTSSWVSAELADPDNDGVPNWQEYRAHTDPRSKTSRFVIRNVTRLPNGRFQVTFSTSSERSYRVEASSDLVYWETVEDGIPGINQDVTVTDTRLIGNPDAIFYRVVVY